MDDSKLERIAKFEIAGLQPEVIPIVISEIQKRGLDKNLLTQDKSPIKFVNKEIRNLINESHKYTNFK
ncbi:MAG: hypothetical protein IPK35_21315 [Saprospiraceae bacterium]|nr:hypothetical protein [Saprospiraceae bacterium]